MRKLILGCFLILACGRDTDSGTVADAAKGTVIKVRPEVVQVAPKAQALFTATPASISVTWSVQEADGGSITAGGLYTAPSTDGIFHVLATNGSTVGQATVTVASPVAIATPPTAVTDACLNLQLSATVTGSSNTSVTWALPDDPGCGTISSTGVFVSANISGTCRAEATSAADTTKKASTMITVNQKVLSIVVTPSTVNLNPSGQQQFSGTVTTTCGTFPATSP